MALLTVKEAAERLGLKSRNSIYRKIRNKELPYITAPDGTPRIKAEGLEELWKSITRTRGDSPKPVDPLAAAREERRGRPLRPAAERMKPKGVVDQAPVSVSAVRVRDEELPEYNESRARSEFERANLLELERRQKEGLLIPTDKVEKVWSNAVAIARTKLLAVPSRMRQRIPHLTVEEIALAEELIRESLEELASGLEEESDDE